MSPLNEIFQFQGHTVRVYGEPDKPIFVAKDVCDVLDIRNGRDAISSLDDDEKDGVVITDAIGRSQQVSGITESGLYALIFKSRKEAAKKFRKWVTAEVLPSIRKTGSYELQDRAEEATELINDPDLIIQLATEVKNLRRLNTEKDNLISEMRPLADFGMEIKKSDELFTITQVAKFVGTTSRKLNLFLKEQGCIMRHQKDWFPTAKYQESGYFRIMIGSKSEQDTETCEIKTSHYYQLKVTGKGHAFINDLWAKKKASPDGEIVISKFG